jgi:hypothetical protein
MPLILGTSRKEHALYLEACRKKRNTVGYDYVGGASKGDARELLEFTRGFKKDVVGWLEKNHRDLT